MSTIVSSGGTGASNSVGPGVVPVPGVGGGVGPGVRGDVGGGVGRGDGCGVPPGTGEGVGGGVGPGVGCRVGGRVGGRVGPGVGGRVGCGVGLNVGLGVGAGKGRSVGGGVLFGSLQPESCNNARAFRARMTPYPYSRLGTPFPNGSAVALKAPRISRFEQRGTTVHTRAASPATKGLAYEVPPPKPSLLLSACKT